MDNGTRIAKALESHGKCTTEAAERLAAAIERLAEAIRGDHGPPERICCKKA